MAYWRIAAFFTLALVGASPCAGGVGALWLGSREGPASLAEPQDAFLRLGQDSLAWLRMDQSGWRKSAGLRVRGWLDAATPTLHRLTPAQLAAYVDAIARSAVWAQWQSMLLKKKPATQQGERGLLKDIELPVKLPGLLGQVVSGKAGLRVSGRQRLELGGKSSYQVGELADPNRSNSKFPQLHMEQELRVSLKGNVGDKISVLVDHDSAQRSSDKNKIRIRYEGTEDEILREIEAGNTSLSLGSGPEFITPSFSHQGLFGIRAGGQLGPATLTLIASKEESQKQTEAFSGFAKDDTLRINDTQYVHNQFFAVLVPPGSPSLIIDPTDSVTSITVYVDNQIDDPDRIQSGTKAVCYLNPKSPSEEETYRGVFKVLREGADQDYIFTRASGILELKRPLTENEVLAVAYTSRNQGSVGGQALGDSVALKLIKPPNVTSDSKTWVYELRNVYYLGSRSIDTSNFRLTIKRIVASGTDVEIFDGRTYLNRLGLDNDRNGQIDLDRSVLDPERGILIFPYAEPFNAAAVLDTVNPIIYREQYSRLKPEHNLFYLEAQYKLLKSSYDLSPFMIEGSEVVKVNGRTMARGQDYDIEFYELRFRPGIITGPDDKILISYEVRPLFAAGQKTLLGARVELPMSRVTRLGATWMYQGEGGQRTTLLPRFGEEPRRSMVAGIDGRIEFRPEWLTDAVNMLPLVTTDVASAITFSAEAAFSMPNPNTRGGASVDDMEGNRISTSLPLVYRRWSLGSLPPAVLAVRQDLHFYWHNFGYSDPDKLRKGDIYPDSVLTDERERDQLVEVLNLRIHPASDSPTETWASIQTCVQPGGADFTEREYLEVLVRGETGRLHVDLGALSEDQARDGLGGNGVLDTEDQHPRDGVWQALYEDTGLDGLFDRDEPGEGPDPAGDNYPDESTRNPRDYTRINGAEGNQREDTEDLDGNGQLDVNQAYHSFTLPLSGNSPFVEAEYRSGWKLFRIPLRGDHVDVTGSPAWSSIEYCRIWVEGLTAPDSCWVQVASLEVVGSTWRSSGVETPEGAASATEQFRVKVRNNKDDAAYVPPFDPGEDERTGYTRREQSLVLAFENLGPGHWGSAYQSFYREQDLSGYRGIAVWVRPHEIRDYTGRSVDPTVWLRLGANETNYYEVRFRAPADEWRKVEIDLDALTRTKVEGVLETGEGALLRVVGSPSITRIRRATLGVENPSGRPLTGEVWVDELQVVRVKREQGAARRTSLKIQMADLASFDADYRSLDATFTRLDQRGSTGATSSTATGQLSGTLSLDQFFPDRWGLRLPVGASWSSRRSTPRLATGSDVPLTGEEKRREEASDQSTRVSFNLSKATPSRNPIVRATVDRIRISLSSSSTRSRGPTRADTTVAHHGSIDWSWASGAKRPLKVPLIGAELHYLPTTLSLGLSAQQTDPKVWVLSGDSLTWSPTRFTRDLTEKASVGFQPVKSLDVTYSFNATRDLTYRASSRGEHLLDERLRPTSAVLPFWRALDARETRRNHQMGLRLNPRLASWFDPSLTYDTTYGENHDPALTAATPDSHDVRDATSNTSSRARATFSPSQLLSWLSKLSGKTKWMDALARAGGRLQAIQGSIGTTVTSSYRELGGRPPMGYQFGLWETIDGRTPYDFSRKNSWDVSGGLQILKDLRTTARASSDRSRRSFSGAETATTSTTFPDIDLSWTGLHALGPLKGKVASSTVRSAFRVTSGNSGRYEGGAFDRDGETRREDYSPLVSVSLTLKNGLTITLGDNYSTDERVDLLQAQPMTRTSSSHRSNLGVQYAFSAPQGINLPLFGMMRFKSNLRLTLDVSRERRLERTGATTPTTDTSSWSVRPGASYDFGVVDSGLQIEVAQSSNHKLNQTRREIGLRIWVNFPF